MIVVKKSQQIKVLKYTSTVFSTLETNSENLAIFIMKNILKLQIIELLMWYFVKIKNHIIKKWKNIKKEEGIFLD